MLLKSKIRQYMTYKTHELVICAEEALYYVHPEALIGGYNDDD